MTENFRAQVQCHCMRNDRGHLWIPDRGCPPHGPIPIPGSVVPHRMTQALTLLKAFEDNINPHVLPDDVKALIADSVLAKVDREVIASYMIEMRNMHRTIKWLIEHLDECHHAELDRDGPDHANLLLTTLDDVQQWLEDMSAVLGAEGYDGAVEEEE